MRCRQLEHVRQVLVVRDGGARGSKLPLQELIFECQRTGMPLTAKILNVRLGRASLLDCPTIQNHRPQIAFHMPPGSLPGGSFERVNGSLFFEFAEEKCQQELG